MALSEQQIRQIAEAVLAELAAAGKLPQKSCGLKQPQDEKALRRMLRTTTARIGIGNAGPRLKTQTLLTLRADHAAARDAVMMDVDQGLLDSLGLFTVQTCCSEKNEFLTGRIWDGS